jgi:hypothetical protein
MIRTICCNMEHTVIGNFGITKFLFRHSTNNEG